MGRHPRRALHARVRNVHVPTSSRHRTTATWHVSRRRHSHSRHRAGRRLDPASRPIDSSRQHVPRSNENHARNMGRVFLANARRHGNACLSYRARSVKQRTTAEVAWLDRCRRLRRSHDPRTNNVRGDNSFVALHGHHLPNADGGRIEGKLEQLGNKLQSYSALHPSGNQHLGDFAHLVSSESSTSSENRSAPRGIRTPDLLVRSQTLYPTELEALIEDRSVRGPNLMLKLNIWLWRRGWDLNPRTA